MDTFRRRSRQAPLRRVFMMLGLALVLSAGSGTVGAPPFGWEGGRNGRYWLPEDEIDYGEPPPPPRNRPYHSQRPRPQPRPDQDDLRKTLAVSVPLLQRMIQLAAEDGGIGHIADIQGLKRRIEALPKPAPGDSKAARILFDNGAVAYEGGLLADAARYYADARKKDPSDVEIVANLGFTYIKLGDLKAAIEPLTAAVTLAPSRSARWTNLAEYYARNGQSREAAACYALAAHFSRNSTKTVEFIQERAQDPDPKVRQAAQQALQLSFIRSVNAQAKATLEAPLTGTGPKSAPIVSSESEPLTTLESSTATPSTAKIDREHEGLVLGTSFDVIKAKDSPLYACKLNEDGTTGCWLGDETNEIGWVSFKDNVLVEIGIIYRGPNVFEYITRENTKRYGPPKVSRNELPPLPGTPISSQITTLKWEDVKTKLWVTRQQGTNIKGEPMDATLLILRQAGSATPTTPSVLPKIDSPEPLAPPTAVPEEPAFVGAQPPNPATVLDEPVPASESESKLVTNLVPKQDNKWYAIRTSTQQCDQVSSPAEQIWALRENGIEPTVQDFRDVNGNVIKVNITISNGLTTGTVTSYRHIDDCKAELAKKTAIPDEYK